MATKEKTKKRQSAGNNVAPMKKSKRVPSKKNIAKKKAAPKRIEAKRKSVLRRQPSTKRWPVLRNRFGGKAYGWIRRQAHWRERWLGRASNREICRDCPTSKVRIRRVWTSCSRKETLSRPRR